MPDPWTPSYIQITLLSTLFPNLHLNCSGMALRRPLPGGLCVPFLCPSISPSSLCTHLLSEARSVAAGSKQWHGMKQKLHEVLKPFSVVGRPHTTPEQSQRCRWGSPHAAPLLLCKDSPRAGLWDSSCACLKLSCQARSHVRLLQDVARHKF